MLYRLSRRFLKRPTTTMVVGKQVEYQQVEESECSREALTSCATSKQELITRTTSILHQQQLVIHIHKPTIDSTPTLPRSSPCTPQSKAPKERKKEKQASQTSYQARSPPRPELSNPCSHKNGPIPQTCPSRRRVPSRRSPF